LGQNKPDEEAAGWKLAKISSEPRLGTDSARFQGMFVILSLVVSAVAPVAVVIVALLRAPEAYENEHGLQIVHKRSPQIKRVALAKRFS
jgi:hypothetical protein